MRKLFGRFGRSSLSLLYDEARLPAVIRRSLNLILLGNIFGNLHGIICGGFGGFFGSRVFSFRIFPADKDRDADRGGQKQNACGGDDRNQQFPF